MKHSVHLRYPQIGQEISLLVGHLLFQWFCQWWYALNQTIKVFQGDKSDRSCLLSTFSQRAFSLTEHCHSRLATSVILLRNVINQPWQPTRQPRPLNAQPESTASILTNCVHTYIPTYNRRTYVPTYVPMYLRTRVRTYLPTYLPTYMPSPQVSPVCRQKSP